VRLVLSALFLAMPAALRSETRCSKDEMSVVLKSDFQGAQLVFPGFLDGLLTELQ
jgi:hypothetical protein